VAEVRRGAPLKRGRPLERRAPLGRKVTLEARQELRRTGKLAAVGVRKKRVAEWMEMCRAFVLIRSEGCCEFCPNPENEELDWHHIFGRTFGVSGASRWPHVPECTAMICRTCHRRWHDGVGEGDAAWRWSWQGFAQARLSERYGVYAPTARLVIVLLTAAGVEPEL
jgi:hypothetical protein